MPQQISLMEWNIVPTQYKLIALALFLVIYAGMFYSFGHTAAKSKCTSEKLEVAETTIETTSDNIEAHNESAKANKNHSAGNKVVVAKATNDIIELENVSIDSHDCSAGANVRLQQEVYNQFPASLFVQ